MRKANPPGRPRHIPSIGAALILLIGLLTAFGRGSSGGGGGSSDKIDVVGYSTPETIYRDTVMSDTRQVATARTPESAMLSMVGLPHPLHPDAPTHITETFHRRSGHH